MNAIFLVFPLLLVRYGAVGFCGRDALERAAHFPSAQGVEKHFLPVYQISVLALVILPAVYRVGFDSLIGLIGTAFYFLGILLYGIASFGFARGSRKKLNTTGIYGFSRNPMYLGFFVAFVGICLLARSWTLAIVLIIHQISVHFLILSEERWCLKEYGHEFAAYCRNVRRYF